MVAFPKPKFDYSYRVEDEIAALRAYRDTEPGRRIPAKTKNALLLASWNVANLGVQQRRPSDYRLIAEMMGWFDLVAVQEVNDNLSGLRAIHDELIGNASGADWRLLFSDQAGNNERTAFVYDASKVRLLEMVGEIDIPPSQLTRIKLPGNKQKFTSFDRNPYLAAFQADRFRFTLVNVHLYYGKDDQAARDRRSLETFAVALWADGRRRSKNSYAPDVIAVGDFNMPKAEPGDPIYAALTRRGLVLPAHTSKVGSTIAEEKKDNEYDQIAFFPGLRTTRFTGELGIFDFDGAVFARLYQDRSRKDFRAYVRYYLSDHRILWARFRTD